MVLSEWTVESVIDELLVFVVDEVVSEVVVGSEFVAVAVVVVFV